MKILSSEQIASSVSEAVEENKFLTVGDKIPLEYLDQDYDGIFESEKSWKAFIRGNFLDGDYFLSEVKPSTLKKWCYPVEQYQGLFAVKVGQDKFIQVQASELSFSYDFEVYYSKNSNFPTAVEIFVKAKIK